MAARTYIRSSKTRQHIYRVASNLFLEKGYEATTLKDIAEAADVSTGTLYRYFPSKGDFLVEIGRASVEHLTAFAEELPDDMQMCIRDRVCTSAIRRRPRRPPGRRCL